MAVDVEELDWLHAMRIYGGNTPEVFDERLDTDWIVEHCLTACDIAFAECPAAEWRLDDGSLAERTFMYVICSMVLRVARWTMRKSESNGAYTRTDQVMDMAQPGWEISPDLHLTKKERMLLDGTNDDDGTHARFAINMGLDRIYGL